MDDLKPCPFCGFNRPLLATAKPFFMPKKYVGMFIGVYCPNCNAQTGLFNKDNKTRSPLMNKAHEKDAEQRAIEAWNRRDGDGDG